MGLGGPTGLQPFERDSMPLYEFRCSSCHLDFDDLVRSADDISSVCCPSCGSGRVERKISVFSAHSAASPVQCPLPAGGCPGCPEPGGACGMM